MPYVDPTFGFELRVPAGWSYDRSRFEAPQGAIGVLRGSAPDGLQALQILIFRNMDTPEFSVWLEDFLERMGQVHGGRRVPESHTALEGGERAIMLIDARTTGRRTQTYYVCVPFDARTVWVLVLASAVANDADEQAVRACVEQIADSVQVLYDRVEAHQIEAAFERGLAVLRELRVGAAHIDIDATEHFYEFVVAGQPVGYLVRQTRPEERPLDDPRFPARLVRGLRVREESWRFAEDGTVRHTEINLFSSFDLRNELIEHRSTLIPAADVPSQRLYIELDQCVRQGDALVSSFSTNVEPGLPDPQPPLPIGPRYLDLAWIRLLPRLLLAAPQEWYAFAAYDSQTRALGVYMIRPQGSGPVPGSGVDGLSYETREGFMPQASRVYTDQRGHVMRMESGDLAVVQVSRAEVEQRYAARREPARQRMRPETPSFVVP
jgi:hypothetical protein